MIIWRPIFKVEPGTLVTSAVSGIQNMEELDGNSQLWLCLQDISLASFTDGLNRAERAKSINRVVESDTKITEFVYQTEIVIVTGDHWTMSRRKRKLLDADGNPATEESVQALVHAAYDNVSMIVCRQTDSNYNEDKIKRLCKGRDWQSCFRILL